jgi:iron(III) transport system substrate-binding protein
MRLTGAALAVVVAASFALTAQADNLTPQSRKVLADAKLNPALMNGLDKELAVPAAMVEAAKKEGKVAVALQMAESEFDAVFKVFSARYPGLEYSFIRAIGPQHVRILVAYKAGTVLADVVASLDARAEEYHAIGIENVRDLPAYASLPEEVKAMKGGDAVDTVNRWCAMYSKERVKAADLPKTWDDLLTSPRWRNGKIGVASNAGQTWLPTLAVPKGEGWTKNYLEKFFGEVKPQLRKETLSAIAKLITVGEYDFGFAVQDFVIERDEGKGMPVSAVCPEPIPLTYRKIGILSGSKRKNAAKLFLNWFMSREGQIAAFHYARAMPAHTALKGREFIPYPDQVVGRKALLRDDAVFEGQPKVMETWRNYWERAGGAKLD